jgi:4-aminobutyrate aminotransferase-like enzyme
MGAHLLARLRTIKSPLVKDVRGKGLFVGLEVDSERINARDVVDRCSRAASCRRTRTAPSCGSRRRSHRPRRRSTGPWKKCAPCSWSWAGD